MSPKNQHIIAWGESPDLSTWKEYENVASSNKAKVEWILQKSTVEMRLQETIGIAQNKVKIKEWIVKREVGHHLHWNPIPRESTQWLAHD